MGLHVYYSDRIEVLADDLKKRLKKDRAGKDPFVFSSVVVPNTNISKWLKIRVFADEPSLCAGIDYPFIDGFLIDLIRESLPDQGKSISILPMNAYSNAIMRILMERDDEDLFPFRKYVNSTGGHLDISTAEEAQKGWQLATTLAGLVDTYEVRRSDLIDKWLKGDLFEEMNPDAVQRAEAALIRHLFGKDGIFPEEGNQLSLRQIFKRAKERRPKKTSKKLFFFGISTLTRLQAAILQWLSQTNEVFFYHNSVCLEFWGDIQKQITGDLEIENPLLSAWGIAGRESMNHLVSIEEQQEIDWQPIEPRCPIEVRTVLQKLQSGVRNRIGVSENDEKLRQDVSVQIFGAPGIRREVETVYDAIIGAVRDIDHDTEQRPWDTCGFSDVAVLVPDMATYRPVIEAVFDARGEIPYALIDTTASEDSFYLKGLLDLIHLQQEGLNRDSLFAVLDNPCVQYALGFSTDDLSVWRGWVESFGGFDGFNTDDLAARGHAEEKYFTWDWMFKRLRLGSVADDLPLAPEDGAGEMPLGNTNDHDSLLRFSAIIELLYRELHQHLRHKRLPCVIPQDQEWQENWYHHIASLMATFLAVVEDDLLESNVRRQILRVLYSLETFKQPQSLEFVAEAINMFVGGLPCRKGGYLTHGVTIAGLQPMRPVPFKQVFILGLGEGSFPGTKSDSTLDLQGLGRKVADAATPEINRYLFLETLMATKERLVLSYPNKDICKDAELFPCSVIRTLREWLDKLVEGGFKILNVPLLQRDWCCTGSIKWHEGDAFAGLLPTYSKSARQIAIEKMRPVPRPEIEVVDLGEHPVEEVSPKIAAAFVRDPFHAVVQYKLKIPLEQYQGESLESESPLEVADGPFMWGLRQELVESDESVETIYQNAEKRGMSPDGFLGEYSQRKFKGQCEGLAAARLFVRRFESGPYRKLTYGLFGDENYPPSIVLQPFCEALADLKKDPEIKPSQTQNIQIGVVCFNDEGVKFAVWEWSISPEQAKRFYDSISDAYFWYLRSPEEDRKYVTVRYTDLMKSLPKDYSFSDIDDDLDSTLETILEKVVSKVDQRAWANNSSHNNDFTIEQVLSGQVRLPDVEEFKKVIWGIDRFPLSGKMVSMGEEE